MLVLTKVNACCKYCFISSQSGASKWAWHWVQSMTIYTHSREVESIVVKKVWNLVYVGQMVKPPPREIRPLIHLKQRLEAVIFIVLNWVPSLKCVSICKEKTTGTHILYQLFYANVAHFFNSDLHRTYPAPLKHHQTSRPSVIVYFSVLNVC